MFFDDMPTLPTHPAIIWF